MDATEFLQFFSKIEARVLELDSRGLSEKRFLSSAKALRETNVISYDLYKAIILVFDHRLKLLEKTHYSFDDTVRYLGEKVLRELYAVGK